MSTHSSPSLVPGRENDDYSKKDEKNIIGDRDVSLDEPSVDQGVDILALQDTDPALNAKMHIVNNVRGRKCYAQSPKQLLSYI